MSLKWVSLALFACSTALGCWAQGATVAEIQTAVHIAEAAAIKVYGEQEIDAEQPLTVLLNRGKWEVYGTPCCPDRNGLHTCEVDRCVGGVVHISIRQSDGKVLSIKREVMPRVTFTWREDATPQTTIYEWRSSGYGCGGGGGGGGGQYILGGLCGDGPIRHAKVAIYASGCQSEKLDFDLPASEITKTLQCEPLPNQTLRGFIPPDQIPRVPLDQGPVLRPLEIFADLETRWMHEFLNGPSKYNEDHVSLRTVGVIDPARNGDFEITIPDFSSDPSFSSYAASGRNYGLIKFRLYEKTSGMNLGTIVPIDSLEPGLKVEAEYPDTVVFKVVR